MSNLKSWEMLHGHQGRSVIEVALVLGDQTIHKSMACHGNFGPAKKLVRGTKIPGIMVRQDHFPLKNLVRTWNNGLSAMFDRNCRL